jgi:hypothetical protein
MNKINIIIRIMMKNILKITCAVIAFSMTTQYYSQATFGVRAGLNLANMTGKALDGLDNKSLTTFNVGAVVDYELSESLSLESGLFLSNKGYKIEFSGGSSTLNINYLEIPVNVSYKLDVGDNKLNLFAGPYIGLAMGGKLKTDVSGIDDVDIEFGTDDTDQLKGSDFGLNVGAGFQIEKISIRAQYALGLSNLDPAGESDMELKNAVIGISLGYMF